MRQTTEFIEDHVGQVIVKHVNLHVSWLAALAVQVPLGVMQDMVGHQGSDHMTEGFLHHGISVEVGIHMGSDLLVPSIVSSCVKGGPAGNVNQCADSSFESALATQHMH